jgi:hypothetical protein
LGTRDLEQARMDHARDRAALIAQSPWKGDPNAAFGPLHLRPRDLDRMRMESAEHDRFRLYQ